MTINNINSQFAMFSLQSSQAMTENQMTQIIQAGNAIQQAPANDKIVNQVNKAIDNMHIDITA